MKIIIFLSSFFILLGCSETSVPTNQKIRKNGLQFSFEAHYMSRNRNSVEVEVELKNISKDTMYFYISSCNSWIGEADLRTDNLCGFADAIFCPDTIPIISTIAPLETKKSTFSYALCDDAWMKVIRFRTIKFGLRCYPVKKNAVTNENLHVYLKNRQCIKFKPTTIEIMN